MNATTNTPALVMDSVTRRYPDGPTEIVALNEVSLTVNPGELVAVMGPSGSGKSTLLQIAGTLDSPSTGTVTVAGTDVSHMSAADKAEMRRKHVGFVFQSYNLVETLTVAENVALPLELDGVAAATARGQAVKALDNIGLADLADRFPAEVSGGERQRVAIARGLVGTRRLILADEPTGALDTSTAEAVMGLIREQVDRGAAAVVVTHEPRFAAWADRVIYLRDGRMVSPAHSSYRVPAQPTGDAAAGATDPGNGNRKEV
ncbi:ABC transporter ATP-binding protein [Corynebacterium mendelii]|uniref:ABC transporter ATP-binding protein n=1 Tax=Corynebacterium mendelii TaxID=2765362 RepID=A0A939IXU4_9CORY|nr:ABC transporter ATP-binding protein [Corynebacterium mendelii]MBN9644423.1 ABC transporter ATP-binding protein [Corynebacterium mendelii]